MAELPLDQAIPRFKTNEERIDTFVNGDENATYTTSGGVHVPSVRKVVADINEEGEGWLAQAEVARDAAVAAADRAEEAAAAALFDPDNYQPKDDTLTSLAALGTAPGKIAYTTGVDTWAETPITAAGRALLDDTDAAAQRATLGLGAAATAGFLDEDDFASDSATAAPSQQSTKAYVNAAIPAKLNASGAAPVFACRAWVNFNGTTGAIRAAGNVSSITKNGTGDYRVNFATAMPDANYSGFVSVNGGTNFILFAATSASYADIQTRTNNGSPADLTGVHVGVFR